MSDDISTPGEFGLLDVIEAFTALRHEYRNQTKESRAATESLNATTAKVDDFTRRFEKAITTLQNTATSSAGDAPPTKPSPDRAGDDSQRIDRFATSLAEIDHMVSRSVDAATRSLAPNHAGADHADTADAADDGGMHTAGTRRPITDRLATFGPITRFFCRKFARQLDVDLATEAKSRDSKRRKRQAAGAAVVGSGLTMTADHVRRRIADLGIERIDVHGNVFDGNLMRVVEVVESTDVPPGHVAEQLSPAYRFDERVIRYADVRLTRPD